MKQRQSLKKGIAILVLLTAIGLPLACTTNNTSNPTSPLATPTPGGPTATFTTTLVPGSTPTFTPTSIATPVFVPPAYGESAAPNGMYYDALTSTLYVATGELKGGDITMFEEYTVSGGTLSGGTAGNQFTSGYPTPEPAFPTPTIAFSATTITSTLPQGFAKAMIAATPYYAMLDSSASGAATLWEGCFGFDQGVVPYGDTEYPTHTDVGYGGAPLLSPRAVAGDNLGNFYVADTGNAYIDEFGAECVSGPPPNPAWEHRWNASTSSKPFIKPVAVVCDSSNHVYVGDSGYSPSIVEEWESGGVSLIGMWNLTSGCVLNGLAVDNNGDFYVSNTGGSKVEEYKISSSSSASLLRAWGKPPSIALPWTPSAIALIMTGATLNNIVVGDTNNDLLVVFGP